MTSCKKLFIAALAIIALLAPPQAIHAIASDQDTDGDGITDIQEDNNLNEVVDTGETNPYNTDSDGGGESDGSEVKALRNPLDQTDDLTFDVDGDGWVNGIELVHGTDPKKPDTDGDGINDPADPFPLDAKFSKDDNRNGLPDDWEQTMSLDGSDVLQTKVDDPDKDGLNNAQELARGTNPTEADTDRDGISDKDEIDHGGNPRESACLEYDIGGQTLSDIEGHWAKDFIVLLGNITILPRKLPIVRGYSLGSAHASRTVFNPDRPVTRFEFLKMAMLSSCTRLMNSTDAEKSFSDVSNEPPENESPDLQQRRQVIYTAVHYGVIGGYDDGTFRPDTTVNRAEATKMLMLALQMVPSRDSGALALTDVRPEDWFEPFVRTLALREIISGYGDGTFRGGNVITRAESAKIIAIALRQNPLVNGYVLPD
jgi:hypothetical protein